MGDVTIDQSVGGTATLGNVNFQKLSDTANTSYFVDPAATGDSLVLAGTATASGNLTVGNTSAIRSAFGPLSLQYKSGLNAWTTGITLQDTTGNVGIGTTGPAQKLSVSGIIESTSGGFKFPDGSTKTTAAISCTTVSNYCYASTCSVACPSGYSVTGGGVENDAAAKHVSSSYPSGNGWYSAIDGGTGVNFRVYAVCCQ